jgi:hypothetical protein
MMASPSDFMRTLTWCPATALVQFSTSVCRSPVGLTDLIPHDAMGVRRRFPEMMKAGAKISTGFLKEAPLPVDEKTSVHLELSVSQAPW